MKNINKNLENIAKRTNGDIRAIGTQTLALSASPTINYLTVPTNAEWADIYIEADDWWKLSDPWRVLRFKYDGATPTSTDGLPASCFDVIHIGEKQNLENFKALVLDAGTGILTLQIQYYKT
jgi:hypothetical protein